MNIEPVLPVILTAPALSKGQKTLGIVKAISGINDVADMR